MITDEKYTRDSEKLKDENKDKIVISDDAYAIVEAIDRLTNVIRLKW